MATPSKLREFWDWGRALIEALTALRNAFGCCEFALVDRDWDGDPIGLYYTPRNKTPSSLCGKKIAELVRCHGTVGGRPAAKLELVRTGDMETNAAYAGPAAAMIVEADINATTTQSFGRLSMRRRTGISIHAAAGAIAVASLSA